MQTPEQLKAKAAARYQKHKAAGIKYPSELKRTMAKRVECRNCGAISFLNRSQMFCGPVCSKQWRSIKEASRRRKLEYKAIQKEYRIREGRAAALLREARYRARAKESGKWKMLCKARRARPANRLRDSIQRAIRCRLGKGTGSPRTEALTGCTMAQLVSHIESTFSKGMSWDNYGEWHIDHIIPCASWDLSDNRQVSLAFHWTNLQALWAADNLRKQDKITAPQISLPLSA